MRALVPVALLALLLVPAAAAEDPRAPFMRLTLDSFGGAIMPLSGNGVANGTLEAPCIPSDDGRPHQVTLEPLGVPSWANVVVQPSALAVPTGCEGMWSTDVQVVATLTHQAPAYRPATLRLQAAGAGGSLGPPVSASVDVIADYFGLLEVQVLEPIKSVKPRETATFAVKVTNAGNGRAEVSAHALNASGGLVTKDAGPVILESAQQGGNETSAILELVVETRGGSFYVNEAAIATYAITERYVDGGTSSGDQATISVIVQQKGLDAPGPGAAPLLAALGLAALGLAGRRASR